MRQASAGITPTRLHQLQDLLAAGREELFYAWPEWKATRKLVLDMDRHECVYCRERWHRFRAAVLVHHVRHLRDRPNLALSIWDPDTGARQLVSVCKQCHEDEHPESFRRLVPSAAPITRERWD